MKFYLKVTFDGPVSSTGSSHEAISGLDMKLSLVECLCPSLLQRIKNFGNKFTNKPSPSLILPWVNAMAFHLFGLVEDGGPALALRFFADPTGSTTNL